MSQYTVGYFSTIQYLHEPQVLEELVQVRQEDRSFPELMQLIGRFMPLNSTSQRYFVDQPIFETYTISSFVDNSGTAGTDLDITLNTASHNVIPGNLVMFSGANKRMGYVKSVNGAVINVVAYDGNNLEAANGMTLSFHSYAGGEGTAGPQPFRVLPKAYDINVQIFKAKGQVTDMEGGSKLSIEVGGRPYVFFYAQHNAFMKLMGYVTYGALWNEGTGDNFAAASPNLTDANGNPVNVTKGLYPWIRDNGINIPTAPLDLAFFSTLNKSLDRAGAGSTFLMVGGADATTQIDDTIKALNGTILDNARFNVDGRQVDLTLESFRLYGRHYIKKKITALNHTGVIDFTGSQGHEKDLFILPLDTVPLSRTGKIMPRLSLVYVPMQTNSAPNRIYSQDGAFEEIRTGGLAPGLATSDQANVAWTYTARVGVRPLGIEHFAHTFVQ